MDLRQFLADLGDDVLTVRERVSCLEIPKRIEAEEKSANRAIVFEAISDYPGPWSETFSVHPRVLPRP